MIFKGHKYFLSDIISFKSTDQNDPDPNDHDQNDRDRNVPDPNDRDRNVPDQNDRDQNDLDPTVPFILLLVVHFDNYFHFIAML